MSLSKFILLSLIFLTAQGFAASVNCIDLSGDYKCAMQNNGVVHLSITYKINSEQAPVYTMKTSSQQGRDAIFEYIADKQVHGNYIATCQE